MPYQILLTVEDAKGRSSSMKFYMLDSTPYAEVVTYAQEFATRMEPLTVGAIRKIAVTQTIPLPAGLKTIPVAVADVEEKMRITYRTEFNHSFAYSIPAYNEQFASILYGSSEKILDFLEPEVEAFYNLNIAAAAAGFTDNPCDTRSETLFVIKKSSQRFYKR